MNEEFAGQIEKSPEQRVVSKDQVKDAFKSKEIFGALLGLEGWHALEAVIRAQIAERQQRLAGPLPSGDKVYEQEFFKGEIVGLNTILYLPRTLVENSEAMIEAYRSQKNGEEQSEDS